MIDQEHPAAGGQGDALPPAAKAHLGRIAQRLQEYAEAPAEHGDGAKLVDLMAAMPGVEITHAVRAAIAAVTAVRTERARTESPAITEVVEFEEVVARRLRALRSEAGWTQSALAEAMVEMGFAWSRVTVSEVEAGNRRVALNELLALAALYAVPMATLLLPALTEAVAFPRLGALDCAAVREMVLGSPVDEKWLWTACGPSWHPARMIAVAGEGDDDWRPARKLWQSRLGEIVKEDQAEMIGEDQ